ncbi:hypothetical protein DFA_09081 [Cavenderia fasciculata]|uniref:Carbohydrate binding domain-containing protein n=1 Tax=Cavenderia fasciculata TaxID=261658 RepID=F4Q6M7_CACFS|nr:uncharacterized protein DFA_09081 [Cavenderia fasciculata]EGG16537.1 hypothetical protein DFA_09081 [Cavenderia fasciculata]|eukprot:XP_004354937.1 hypothetical protein DFA_09081 [Cavenderia fasciculata]
MEIVYAEMKILILLISIISIINQVNGQTTQCKDALKPWFDLTRVGIKISCFLNDGNILYARGQAAQDRGVFKATGSYSSVESIQEGCLGGKDQPFDINQTKPLFFDYSSFQIDSEGHVFMVPVGRPAVDVYVTECRGNIMVAFTTNGICTYHFSNKAYTNLGSESCQDPRNEPPVNQKAATFDTTLNSEWNENGKHYGMFSSIITNTGKVPFQGVVFSADLELRDPSSIYSAVAIVKGQWKLPSYVQSIQVGSTYHFSFIKEGKEIPTFRIDSFY